MQWPCKGNDTPRDGNGWDSCLCETPNLGRRRLSRNQKTYPEAITPYRKPIHGHLTQDQRNVNREISQDRVVVERFFGRLKSYWAVFQRPHRSDRSSVNTLAKICVALTNLKMETFPLYADEPIFRPDPSYGEEEEEEEGRNEVPETLSVLGLHIPSLNTESVVPSSPETGNFDLNRNSSPVVNSTAHRPKRSSRGKGNPNKT